MIDIIWKKLESEGFYNVGIYERTYPDCLTNTTKGYFTINLDIFETCERDDNRKIIPESRAFVEANLYAEGQEPILSHWIRGMGLDSSITKFEGIKPFFDQWISKFKTLKHLYERIWDASNFLKPKNDWRVNAFLDLKGELPDGTDLESFLEGGF